MANPSAKNQWRFPKYLLGSVPKIFLGSFLALAWLQYPSPGWTEEIKTPNNPFGYENENREDYENMDQENYRNLDDENYVDDNALDYESQDQENYQDDSDYDYQDQSDFDYRSIN